MCQQRIVDPRDEPVEDTRVDSLCERVARKSRLVNLEWDLVDALGHGCHRAATERFFEVAHAHPQQRGHVTHGACLGDLTRVIFSLVKDNVAEVQQCGERREESVLLLDRNADSAHRQHHLSVLRRAALVPRLIREEAVVVHVCQLELRFFSRGQSSEEVVKAVVVAFAGRVRRHTRLFEEVGDNVGANEPVSRITVDACKLAEARAVVVHLGLGIAKRFEKWVGLENSTNHRLIVARCDVCDVRHENFYLWAFQGNKQALMI